jgi:hypothetical protein
MNFEAYLHRQMVEDRRAFIVHYPAKGGKSHFAKRLAAKRQDVHVLDFLEYWKEHPELPTAGKFRCDEFRDFLLQYQTCKKVLIIDNLEVLINTWNKRDKQEFLNWLRHNLRSPMVTNKTLVFFLQDDPFFIYEELKNSHGESRILPLSDFEAL